MLRGVLVEARERGWDVEAVFFESSRSHTWIDEFKQAGIPVSFAPDRIKRSRLLLGRWLESHLGDSDEETVLHCHFTAWDVAGLFAARERNAEVFWHVHSALPKAPWIVARTALKFGLMSRATAGIWCPAPNIVDGARHRLAAGSRLQFMPSALDMQRFPLLDAESRALARRELGIEPEATVLLHFGWHWHLKGNDLFLETVAELARGDDSIIAVDRGGDQRMVDYARELGIGDRLRLLDPVPDVRTIHGAADVMVSSSREEGMAYAVLESLASGTPVVATSIPGHEFIGREVAACRLVDRDVGQLAGRTRETLDRNPDQAERERIAGHDWIASNLGIPPIAKRMIDLYEVAFEGPGRPVMRARTQVTAPVRLVHFAQYSNQHPGSFVPMLLRVLSDAVERGWDAMAVFDGSVAGSAWLAQFEQAGVQTLLAPQASRSGLTRWIASLLDEGGERPTIIHTHFTRFDIPAALAAARRPEVSVVWHEHTALSSRPTMIARNLAKFGLVGRKVEGIYAPAPDLADEVARRLGPKSRIHFAPNAINVARFPVTLAQERAEARSELGLDDRDLILANFAWNWDLKGGETFQRLVGQMDPDDGRRVRALQLTSEPQAFAMLQELGLDDRLELAEPTDRVDRIYRAADVFVSTSRAEGGTPFAILEALCTGTAVVASDIPSHRFIAERVPNISIAQPGGFSTAVQAVINRSPDQSNAAASAAHEAVERDFSLADWSARFMRIYDQILA